MMDNMENSDVNPVVTIRLETIEAQFLITILKSSISILTALMALQRSLPGLSPPPFNTDAIVNIAALAGKIEVQLPQ
jgi:hypothetical protein